MLLQIELHPLWTQLGQQPVLGGTPIDSRDKLLKTVLKENTFFSNRMVPVWNSLPEHIVNAKNTNEFKNLLDKFDKEKG